jgi:hypothetical protein
MNTQKHTPRSFPDAIAALDSLTFKIIRQPQVALYDSSAHAAEQTKEQEVTTQDLTK